MCINLDVLNSYEHSKSGGRFRASPQNHIQRNTFWFDKLTHTISKVGTRPSTAVGHSAWYGPWRLYPKSGENKLKKGDNLAQEKDPTQWKPSMRIPFAVKKSYLNETMSQRILSISYLNDILSLKFMKSQKSRRRKGCVVKNTTKEKRVHCEKQHEPRKWR